MFSPLQLSQFCMVTFLPVLIPLLSRILMLFVFFATLSWLAYDYRKQGG